MSELSMALRALCKTLRKLVGEGSISNNCDSTSITLVSASLRFPSTTAKFALIQRYLLSLMPER